MTAFLEDLSAGALNWPAVWNAGMLAMLATMAIGALIYLWRHEPS